MDRKFVLSAFGYGILGLVLGIYMAATKNHIQVVTHAHIMLVGFVVSFIYGTCHKLWLQDSVSKLTSIQFYCHQIGAIGLSVCLFLMFKGGIPPVILGPLLAVSSILVLAGLIMMKIMFIKAGKDT